VFEGTLGPIPFASRAQGAAADADRWRYAERLVRIHYVKLSLDASSIDQYPKTVRDRYASHRNRREIASSSEPCESTRDNRACSFPHEPTASLNYSGGEFEAYWDLGRCAIERDWLEPASDAPRPSCGDSRW
jgi:hypothetical protein